MAQDIIGIARANRVAALSHLARKRNGVGSRSDLRVNASFARPHLELVFVSSRSGDQPPRFIA